MNPNVEDPKWLSEREKRWSKFQAGAKRDMNGKELDELKAIYFGVVRPDYDNPERINDFDFRWDSLVSPFQNLNAWEKRSWFSIFYRSYKDGSVCIENCDFESRAQLAAETHMSRIRGLLSGYDYKYGWDVVSQKYALESFYLQDEKSYRPTLHRYNSYYAMPPWNAHEAFFSLLEGWCGWLRGGGSPCARLTNYLIIGIVLLIISIHWCLKQGFITSCFPTLNTA